MSNFGSVSRYQGSVPSLAANVPIPASALSAGTVTQVNTDPANLTGGPITTTGTLNLTDTPVVPGTYGNSTNVTQITVDQKGRITSAVNVPIPPGAVGTVTQVNTGVGLTGGPITNAGTIDIANTGVVAQTYGSISSWSELTVNSQGQVTAGVNYPKNVFNAIYQTNGANWTLVQTGGAGPSVYIPFGFF